MATKPSVDCSSLKQLIREVPDFPKKGILFYDITTLLQDPAGLRAAIDGVAVPYADQGIDLVVGVESRGFIFGSAVATTSPVRLSTTSMSPSVSGLTHRPPM